MILCIQIKEHRLVFGNISGNLFHGIKHQFIKDYISDIMNRTAAGLVLVAGASEKLLLFVYTFRCSKIELGTAVSAKHQPAEHTLTPRCRISSAALPHFVSDIKGFFVNNRFLCVRDYLPLRFIELDFLVNLIADDEDFRALVHNISTTEQDILRFINHEPQAYYIIGSIFNAGGFRFGHHDSYIFPEFRLGNDYRADYLLIGKSSGGYEFIFVEFEKSNGRVTLSSGNPGQVIRSGNYQILDWKYWVDSKFSSLRLFFDTEKQNGVCLPHEFYDFDSTRMHYVVVAGTRDDYNEQTYRCRRREALDSNIVLLHYDNLYDASERLIEQNTF